MFSTGFPFNLTRILTFRNMSTSSKDQWMSIKQKFLETPVDEKRKYYKCGDKFVTIANIPSWDEQYIGDCGKVPSTFQVNKDINKKVSMYVGDITALEIDAIVNAANNALAGGGGVDGAIHSAAGREFLQDECRTLKGCATGDAKITGGYKLPAKCKLTNSCHCYITSYALDVIHTVGPVGENPDALKNCYLRSLDVLKANGLRTVGFPCISTGIYGYPNEAAANVALSATRNWLETSSNLVDRIIFCLFLDVDIKLYQKLLPVYFPRE